MEMLELELVGELYEDATATMSEIAFDAIEFE